MTKGKLLIVASIIFACLQLIFNLPEYINIIFIIIYTLYVIIIDKCSKKQKGHVLCLYYHLVYLE